MPQFGFWQISQAGQDWLSQNPGTRYTPGGGSVASRMPTAARQKNPGGAPTHGPRWPWPAGITLDKLERIRKVMAADGVQARLGRTSTINCSPAEQARAITPLNDRYLLEQIQPLLQRIQDFLQGHGR